MTVLHEQLPFTCAEPPTLHLGTWYVKQTLHFYGWFIHYHIVSMRKETLINSVPALREKARVTQQSLAEIVGVTRQTIIAIERGQYVPSLLLAMKIAKFFHQSIEDIFKIRYEK